MLSYFVAAKALAPGGTLALVLVGRAEVLYAITPPVLLDRTQHPLLVGPISVIICLFLA